jgi:hypothetical protein
MSVQQYPTNTSSTFNADNFSTSSSSSTTVITTTGLTVEEGYSYFLAYPSAQGAQAFPSGLSCTNLTSTNLIYGSSIETTNLDAGDSEILDIGVSTTTTNIGSSGTGTITIGNSNKPLAINSTTTLSQELLLTTIEGSSGTIDIGLSTTTTNIGSGTGSGTITIGNSNKPLAINSTTTLSEELLLTTIEGTSGTIDIGLSTTTMNIGSGTGSGTITIGNSNKPLAINSITTLSEELKLTNIEASSGTLDIGLASTTTNIATGSSTGTITIGNSNKPLTVNSLSTFSNDIILSTSGSYIQFPDGTQQTTALSSSNSVEIYTLLSTNTVENNWIFDLGDSQNNLPYGSIFQYYLFTTSGLTNSTTYPTYIGVNNATFNFDSSQTMYILSQSQIGKINTWSGASTISSSLNFNYFYAYGIGFGAPGQYVDSVVSAYNSQTYSYTANFYNYYLDIINSNGNTLTITSSVKGFEITNSSTAIPSVSQYPTNYITVSASNSILSAQQIKMILVKIA